MTARILIVEDDLALTRVMRDLLVLDGHEVQCIARGDHAIEAVSEFHPDLVLLDINLPGRGGFELCKLFTEQDIPVIITSVRGSKNDRLTGLELGADDYVTKPFDLDELLARVRAVLRRTVSGQAPGSARGTAQFARAASDETARVPAPVDWSPIRILCIDPQPVAIEGLASLIAKEPDMQIVAAASTGEQGVELFQRYRPDIVVLELQLLPGMSGFDVIRELRVRDPNARIVVLTSYLGDEDIFRALQAGAATYVLKYLHTTEIVRFIRQAHAGQTALPAPVQAILTQRSNARALTTRELQVVRLAAAGKQNVEIASSLDIALETVKVHMKNVFVKLGARDRAEAITRAIRRGIVHLP